MLRIDIHSHVVLPGLVGIAGPHGPEIWLDREAKSIKMRVGPHSTENKLNAAQAARAEAGAELSEFGSAFLPADKRIARMDEEGIDMMGITISPLWYFYGIEAKLGASCAKSANEVLAAHVREAGDRLFFMATLPMQDVDAAVEEVDRAVALGARAINLGGENLGGRELDDEAFFPLWERIERNNLPIFMHPYPAHLVSDKPYRDDYNLSWIVGYPSQEMNAFCRFILGGVLDQFPSLKVIIPHGGGHAPYQWGRLKSLAPFMPGVRARKPLEHYLKNFYFDALIHAPESRKFLIDWATPDHIVYGSNWGSPHDGCTFSFIEDLGYSAADTAKMVGGNSKKLFNLQAPRGRQ